MRVPKLVCEVSYASGFASSMDSDMPWNGEASFRRRDSTVSHSKKEFGNTHARADQHPQKNGAYAMRTRHFWPRTWKEE